MKGAELSMIDRYSRRQPHIMMKDMFPLRTDGLCGCGCGAKCTGRRTRWASRECSNDANDFYSVRTGGSGTIRMLLEIRDHEVCADCGRMCGEEGGHPVERPPIQTWPWRIEDDPWLKWEADHIIPVWEGGGGCGLENFQTLCEDCHKAKTKNNAARRAEVRRRDPEQTQVGL